MAGSAGAADRLQNAESLGEVRGFVRKKHHAELASHGIEAGSPRCHLSTTGSAFLVNVSIFVLRDPLCAQSAICVNYGSHQPLCNALTHVISPEERANWNSFDRGCTFLIVRVKIPTTIPLWADA